MRGEAGNIILDILNTNTTHTTHISDDTWKTLTSITSITQTPSPELLMRANTTTSKAANRFATHTIRASLNA